ncbi:B-cell receptor CD22-like isoform X1 [Mixophyes fleayi]|uniref:B-cell receptor CD22-like isoform X1 n=1 Tax=Mixophyes fleayi TaxID=3061075 RepID=UPI003F4DBD7F
MTVTMILIIALFQGFQEGFWCQKWEFPTEIVALIGSCVEIPCTYSPATQFKLSSAVWYLYRNTYNNEVFNSKTYSSVRNDYIRRTSLVPGGSCSLRINPVRGADRDRYYPGIAEGSRLNAYELQNRTITLHSLDSPEQPIITMYGNLIEGKAIIIQCNADHTCASRPPSLALNFPGQTKIQSIQLSGGNWREISQLTYIPSYADNKTPLRCTATYPNGLRSQQETILNINIPPKNVTVTLRGKNILMEGSDVTLICSSISNPAVYTYEWYQGKNKIKLPNRGAEITLRNLPWDIGPYSCTAVNDEGRGESTLTEIPVQFPPKNVTVTSSGSNTLKQGSNVTLICNSISNPAVYTYEWYQGKNKIILPNRGPKITVRNLTRDPEPYSCTAVNDVGRGESALTEIPVQYDDQPAQTYYGVYFALAGIICRVLFSFVVFFYRRKKVCHTSPSPTTGEQQESTYTDLTKRDVSQDYDTLKPVIPAELTVGGGNVTTIAEYENIGTKR